jgi:hypothetical protein
VPEGWIVTVTAAVLERAPLVPVTVSVYVPAVALEEADIERVELADPPAAGVTDDGLKVAVTPGIADAASDTAELNPLTELMLRVELPEPPGCMLTELGEGEIEKSGCGGGVEEPYTAVIVVSEDIDITLSLTVLPVSCHLLKW